MIKTVFWAATVWNILTVNACFAEAHVSVAQNEGLQSPYTSAVQRWLGKWKRPASLKAGEKFRIQCYALAGNSFYIGVEQTMEMSASLSAIAKVLDDLSSYSEIFDDLLVAEERFRHGNQWLVFTEQHIAIPFVPNEKSEMLYWLEESSASKRAYRYQLKSSNHLKSNDGAIVLDSVSSNRTVYSEIDFIDADWGIAKSFGEKRIWKDSVEGLLQSDFAVQLKSEHLDWPNSKVLEESKKQSHSVDIEPCMKARSEFSRLNR